MMADNRKKIIRISGIVLLTIILIFILIWSIYDKNSNMKDIASNENYSLKQVNTKQFKLNNGESYTYHDGRDGIAYLMKLNMRAMPYYYTEAIYEYDYQKDKLTTIKTFDPYTRIFDMKARNANELYYTKVDYKDADEVLTYYVVMLKDGKETILDSGKTWEVLRTPSLEMVNDEIFYLRESMEVEKNEYTMELKTADNQKKLWKSSGQLKNYLVRNTDENLDGTYVSTSDDAVSYFTSTKDKSYLYQFQNGKLTKKTYTDALYSSVVTKNYDILSFESSVDIIDKTTKKITKLAGTDYFARHCYIEEDMFAALQDDGVIIYNIENGKLRKVMIEEIPPETDIDLIRIDKKKLMIVAHRYDDKADVLYDEMYILEIK